MMKIPAGHKKEERHISGPEAFETPQEYIQYLTEQINLFEDPSSVTIRHDVCWGDYQPAEYYLVGFRKMTKEELAQSRAEAKKKREQAKAKRMKKEEEELALLEKLKAKYES